MFGLNGVPGMVVVSRVVMGSNSEDVKWLKRFLEETHAMDLMRSTKNVTHFSAQVTIDGVASNWI